MKSDDSVVKSLYWEQETKKTSDEPPPLPPGTPPSDTPLPQPPGTEEMPILPSDKPLPKPPGSKQTPPTSPPTPPPGKWVTTKVYFVKCIVKFMVG